MKENHYSAGPLDAEQLRQWEKEGYLVVPGVLAVVDIDNMRALYEQVVDGLIGQLREKGLVEDTREDLPLETRFAVVAGKDADGFGRSWRNLISKAPVFDLHHAQGLVNIIAQLTGTDIIGHPVFNSRPKLPHQQITVVPWHQDSAYFGKDTSESLIITCWVPLVPVNIENGCMQVLAGSHREGLIDHHVETREGAFLELPDELVDQLRVVTCPMQPGDVLLMHNLLFHRSLPNLSSGIRWSIDIRYVRDGDNPGRTYWADPKDVWVIRSETQPVTSLDQWLRMTESFPW